MSKLRIMVVDDEAGYRSEISEFLSDCGFEVCAMGSPDEALQHVQLNGADLAILDLRLPQMSGIDLMKLLHKLSPETGVIMISGHADMDSVIQALREGAVDFFPKPFKLQDIRLAIERTKKFVELSTTLSVMQRTCDSVFEALNKQNRTPLVGNSNQIKQVMQLMQQVSANPNTDVLIYGESGTGKELVARGIHYLCHGTKRVFFDVNCTAIPDTLFESEFFGHTRNAFTGAGEEKKGWFEIANGGTLFLDEIGDLPLLMQAKLLRVLEERRIRRVGSSIDIPLNLRIIASTNQNLQQLIAQNRFRNDLFYRLNRFPISVPPLRERPEDIPLLMDYYNQHFCTLLRKPPKPFSAKLKDLMLQYRYPGNVREMRNIIEKAIIVSPERDKELTLSCLPELSGEEPLPIFGEECLNLNQLEQMEIRMIQKALENCDNNKSQAARLLNITRTSLNRKLTKFKL